MTGSWFEELLHGLPKGRRRVSLYTTASWHYRACRAAAVGAGGHLSGPFAELPADAQARAVLSLLELRDDIGLPAPARVSQVWPISPATIPG